MAGHLGAPVGFWRSDAAPAFPLTDTSSIAGVVLPEGEYIYPEGDDSCPPIAYVSTQSLPGSELSPLISAVVSAYPQTGLWPLRMGKDCPIDEAFSVAVEVSDANVLDIYSQHYYSDDPYALPTELLPGSDGLAPEALDCASGQDGHLLLVPAQRPSYCAAALGWTGPVNEELFPPEISAVLRSWEQRWGITPTALSLDWLELTIPEGRMAMVDRQEFVREMWCFCREYAEEYLEQGYHSTRWQLYWD